jgi:hypothetical protein
MRDNAQRGHDQAERDAERKVIDELATRRFSARENRGDESPLKRSA